MKQDRTWLVWSIEHGAWWKPNENGYTYYRESAGRYTFRQAQKIVKEANMFISDTPKEAMIQV